MHTHIFKQFQCFKLSAVWKADGRILLKVLLFQQNNAFVISTNQACCLQITIIFFWNFRLKDKIKLKATIWFLQNHRNCLPWEAVFLHLWISVWGASGPSWSPPPPWPSSSPVPHSAESAAEVAWPFFLNAPAHMKPIIRKIKNNQSEMCINFHRYNYHSKFSTLNISLPTSPSSRIWDSSVSRVIHCSLYISARRWACFRSSCSAW